jgi:rhodanese-related sulfurtransferase
MKKSRTMRMYINMVAIPIFMILSAPASLYAQGVNVQQATMGEDVPTPEASIAEVRQLLIDGSAVLLDSRARAQFVAGHIPGAKNIDMEPDDAAYVAEVEKLLGGDKGAALVLYCNGPNCGASRVLGKKLVEAGFTHVRRFQLGIPFWRTMGGPTVMELEGIVRIFDVDRTAVYFDGRSPEEFKKGSIPGAHNVPADQIDAGVLDKAPKPRQDLNTRIILFGSNGEQARKLADAMAESPYHNVNYYPGTFETLQSAIQAKMGGQGSKP